MKFLKLSERIRGKGTRVSGDKRGKDFVHIWIEDDCPPEIQARFIAVMKRINASYKMWMTERDYKPE